MFRFSSGYKVVLKIALLVCVCGWETSTKSGERDVKLDVGGNGKCASVQRGR